MSDKEKSKKMKKFKESYPQLWRYSRVITNPFLIFLRVFFLASCMNIVHCRFKLKDSIFVSGSHCIQNLMNNSKVTPQQQMYEEVCVNNLILCCIAYIWFLEWLKFRCQKFGGSWYMYFLQNKYL